MPEIFVGIGSNIEPEFHLRAAVASLRARFGWVRLSAVYRNPAVGFTGEDFLNLAAVFESRESLAGVRVVLDEIEAQCGRVRGSPRFAPRTLDIDLLMYGALVTPPPLQLPRPEILQYAYVLKPLADIAPDHMHPVTGRRLSAHWKDFVGDHRLAIVQLFDL